MMIKDGVPEPSRAAGGIAPLHANSWVFPACSKMSPANGAKSLTSHFWGEVLAQESTTKVSSPKAGAGMTFTPPSMAAERRKPLEAKTRGLTVLSRISRKQSQIIGNPHPNS